MDIKKILKKITDVLIPSFKVFQHSAVQVSIQIFHFLKTIITKVCVLGKRFFSFLRSRIVSYILVLKKKKFSFEQIVFRFKKLLFFLRVQWIRFKKYFTRLFLNQKFNSVKFEISVIYVLILGVVLMSFSGVFYFITSQTLYNELDNELKIKAQSISENITTYLENKGSGPQTLKYAVEQTIAHEGESLHRWWYIGFQRSWFKNLEKQDLSEDFVTFGSIDKSLVITSKNLHPDLSKVFLNNTGLYQKNEKFWDLGFGSKEIRVINYPYPTKNEATHIIQVGISKGPVIHLLKQWMISVFISIPIILVLTGFVGRLLASRILRPLDRIITTANRISYENLNLRVEPKLHYQEMDRLIITFNDMISRLEKSFEHIESFSTHVAHELKTPLTIIRGEAELALLKAKSNETKNTMEVIIDEIDTVLRTIEDLLFLSKTNYNPESFRFKEIDLGDLLSQINEQFKLIIAGKNIHFQFKKSKEKVFIRADRVHLRRLFINLLDNALKFTPENGYIKIKMFVMKGKVYVSVSDTGIGISKENLSRVFEQFFYEDHKQKGVGLGLSIAQAIAKAHNSEITVQSQPAQGTTFTVIMPLIQVSKIS